MQTDFARLGSLPYLRLHGSKRLCCWGFRCFDNLETCRLPHATQTTTLCPIRTLNYQTYTVHQKNPDLMPQELNPPKTQALGWA